MLAASDPISDYVAVDTSFNSQHQQPDIQTTSIMNQIKVKVVMYAVK